MKESNQEKVQEAIARLKQIRRKERSHQDKVRLLQLQLYLKAKQEKQYRFYVLYDKIWQLPTLWIAYQKVEANGGSPGVDGQSCAMIREYGVGKFLSELSEALQKQSYRPDTVKRVLIPKTDGGERPLGIPTIRDRVAQMACKLVIEPIFESDFSEDSYGFRPKRSAHDAMRRVKTELMAGHTEIYDADLSKYFDTIPHDKLLKAVEQRISDRRVLRLLKSWLKAPVREPDGRHSGGKGQQRGTPQGGVISPLLANIYLHLLDRIVGSAHYPFGQAGVRLVRYADDFILMGKKLEDWVVEEVHQILERMGLKVNPDKSERLNARERPFQFLGFQISYDRDIFGRNQRFWNIYPSSKSCKKIRQNIREKLRKIGHYPPAAVVRELNPIIRGWMSYYTIAGVSYPQMALRGLNHYLSQRINRYYRRKSQRKCRLYGSGAYQRLVQRYGLIQLYTPTTYRPVNALKRTP